MLRVLFLFKPLPPFFSSDLFLFLSFFCYCISLGVGAVNGDMRTGVLAYLAPAQWVLLPCGQGLGPSCRGRSPEAEVRQEPHSGRVCSLAGDVLCNVSLNCMRVEGTGNCVFPSPDLRALGTCQAAWCWGLLIFLFLPSLMSKCLNCEHSLCRGICKRSSWDQQ